MLRNVCVRILGGASFLPLAILVIWSASTRAADWNSFPELFAILGPKLTFGREEKLACFGEHVCSLAGKVGQDWSCDTRIASCVSVWRDQEVGEAELWDLYACDSLPQDLTAQQIALFRAPQFCEKSPPAAALATLYSAEELDCMNQLMCPQEWDFARRTRCESRRIECNSRMADRDAISRSVCRGWRGKEGSYGHCNLDQSPPWLTVVRGSHESKPRTWQEQAEAADKASRDGDDEFSLGDLDF